MKRTPAINEAATSLPHSPRKESVSQTFLGLIEATDALPLAQRGMDDDATARETKDNTETVIRLLNEALATAVNGILRYRRHYFMTTGINARRGKATFLKHVTEEQAQADQLAERIEQLGGRALLPFDWLPNRSHPEQVEGDSLAEMITANLLAEQNAIQSYPKIIARVVADDHTTRQVLERILVQKEARVESLAGLLRDQPS